MDIDWDWTPVRKGHELFNQEVCACVDFDTNDTFFIEAIYLDGICLDHDDDLFLAIKRDLDNCTRFQNYVNEKRDRGLRK